MVVRLSGLPFEGPYTDPHRIPAEAGIYAPLDQQAGGYYVVDVGESADIRARVSTHDRAQSWVRNSTGALGVWIYLMPRSSEAQRRDIEGRIRAQYRPPCGDR